MKAAIILALAGFAVPLSAQQPAVENAKFETRAVTGSVAASLTQIGSGPFWAAWSEPIIPGRHGDMCSWFRNGDNNYESNRAPGAPMRLEGEVALVILVRVEFSKPGELRVTSPDCRIDAGGLPFYWLTGVTQAESLAFLKSEAIANNHSDTAFMAISFHQGTAPDQILDDLAAPSQPVETRKRAAFWLGNSRGAHGVATLKRMLTNDTSSDVRDRVITALSQSKEPDAIPLVVEAARTDKDAHIRGQALFWLAQRASAQISKQSIESALANDPESAVRERAVFALTQMPNGGGVPMLIDLAKSHRDPNVRKKAMFWLGQSKDPRAIEFFAQVLKP